MDENVHVEYWNGQLFELLGSTHESFFTELIQHKTDLLVQRPRNRKNIPMVIEQDMPVTVYFYNSFNKLYTFESNIRQFETGITLINKPAAHSIKVAQRRRFFRVQVAAEIRLFLTGKSKKVEALTVFTHDISGGGVSFLFSNRVVEEDTEVKGILRLKTDSNEQKVEFKSRVVRVVKQGKNLYQTSLQFVDMSESVRTEIIRFCMFKQVELRNKIIENSSD